APRRHWVRRHSPAPPPHPPRRSPPGPAPPPPPPPAPRAPPAIPVHLARVLGSLDHRNIHLVTTAITRLPRHSPSVAGTPRLHGDRSPGRDRDGYRDGPAHGQGRNAKWAPVPWMTMTSPGAGRGKGRTGRLGGSGGGRRWRDLAFGATDHRRAGRPGPELIER